ncbi:MAG: hypothetical protein PVI57_21700 [Gemmatimonadota bacterium]|jgi:hypothetical protein
MYANCLFCDRSLGDNEVLESFPVGTRVAFDSARGRLWVVCRRCERWNLSPLEERWEAVEDCERLFHETRLRVSTENIGLARHPAGLELVRIGEPVRAEFAAWRYGDQFGRRRRRAFVYGGLGLAVLGTVAIGGVVTGAISGALLGQTGNFVNLWINGRVLVKIRTEDGRLLKLKNPEIQKARVRPDEGGLKVSLKKGRNVEVFRGPEAERVAGLLMTRINNAGGSRKRVEAAVKQIEEEGHPERFLETTLRRVDRGLLGGKKGTLAKLPAETKLAFEMALHEERERRALEGELKELEFVWRREEELASIADDMFLPDGARSKLDRLRTTADEASAAPSR